MIADSNQVETPQYFANPFVTGRIQRRHRRHAPVACQRQSETKCFSAGIRFQVSGAR